MGVPKDVLETARDYIFQPGISVVREALLASESAPVHAMHDPTEGGLATALYEMAEASQVGLALSTDAVPVLPATQEICQAANLAPLGLLASGALLIAVASGESGRLLAALDREGIAAARIGSVTHKEQGVIMEQHSGARATLPTFGRDEVARFFAEGEKNGATRGG